MSVAHDIVTSGAVQVELLSQGTGPVIVMLPSNGRGVEDFDAVAAAVAQAGFRVLRPQPRGVGNSKGPTDHLTLHNYASDVALAIQHDTSQPVLVVGHAFGNVVARMLAADKPAMVRAVILLAATPGKAPPGFSGPLIAPEIRQAVDQSGNTSLPDSVRLAALKTAFFASGHDASVWLSGWYPDAQKLQTAATGATPIDDYFTAGGKPILNVQAADDASVPPPLRAALHAILGDQVTDLVIADAGHALLPEQPQAVTQAITGYAAKIGMK